MLRTYLSILFAEAQMQVQENLQPKFLFLGMQLVAPAPTSGFDILFGLRFCMAHSASLLRTFYLDLARPLLSQQCGLRLKVNQAQKPCRFLVACNLIWLVLVVIIHRHTVLEV